MSGLSAAIGTLSTNVATLDSKTDGFAAASAGIQQIISGFAELTKNNEALTTGAATLAKNGPMLNNGIKTLQSGTTQLLSGLGTLSTQLTNGAGQAGSGRRARYASRWRKNAEVRYKRAGKRREESSIPEQASCLTVQTHWNPA